MATVSIQAKLTTEDLVAAIEQLGTEEVEKVTRRLLQGQASRRAGAVSAREAELLTEIYRAKRPGFEERFADLSEKRRSFTLTPEEHEELLLLVEEAEAFSVRRLEALGELALLRQTTPSALMKQLGLKAPPVV